jgi:hypothetical protein
MGVQRSRGACQEIGEESSQEGCEESFEVNLGAVAKKLIAQAFIVIDREDWLR